MWQARHCDTKVEYKSPESHTSKSVILILIIVIRLALAPMTYGSLTDMLITPQNILARHEQNNWDTWLPG